MTPTEAQRILEQLARNVRDRATVEALRLAIAALRDNVPDQLRAIIAASKHRHVALELIPSADGELWLAFMSPGPMASSQTPEEALAALAEKVKK